MFSSFGGSIVIDLKQVICCHMTQSPLNAHWGAGGAECREIRVGWAMWTHVCHLLSSGRGMGTLTSLLREMKENVILLGNY